MDRDDVLKLSHDEVQHVVVKLWEEPEIYTYFPGDNERRFTDEVFLLRHKKFKSHPGIAKLYGFCSDEEQLAIVYELKAVDSIFNLIPNDDFTWLQRVKVALGFARLLKFFHTGDCFYKPFMIRNLDAAHILVDEDYNPKLCDFGMITGGIFPDRTVYTHDHVIGCFGYIDVTAAYRGTWSHKQDVFAFGIILLSLLVKKVYTLEDREADNPAVYEWAWDEYGATESVGGVEKPKVSLVHPSLTSDPCFNHRDGRSITNIAMICVDAEEDNRPTMKRVVRLLLKLKVVKENAEFFGVQKL